MKKIGRVLCFVAVLCLFFSFVSAASARERILQMDVRAAVGSNAALTVTERIDFVAEGVDIRRGLIRSIPLSGRLHGRRATPGFALRSVTLDGRPVPYELHRKGGNVEIHLGDDSFLQHGEHTYVLTYTLANQLAFHDDGDELYWNVTGDDWIFPIEKATFTLEPPAGASIFEFDAWTGSYRSQGKDWEGGADGAFRTTRALRPGEGFTVSATWTKGFVVEPPVPPIWAFMGRWGRFLFCLSALSVVAWYGGWWFAVGRDPKRGVVLPLFELPSGFSPGFVRYVKKLKFDTDALLAELIDLAARGYLYLKPGSGYLGVSKTTKERGPELSPSQRALLDVLFADGRSGVELGDTSSIGDSRRGTSLVRRLISALPSFYGLGKRPAGSVPPRSPLRLRNLSISLFGLVLFVPLLWLFSFMDGLDRFDMTALVPILFVIIWSAVFFRGLISNLTRKRPAASDGLSAALIRGVSWLTGLISLVIVGVILSTLVPLLISAFGTFAGMDSVVLAVFAVTVLAAAVFAFLMPRRTAEGRRLLDQVEGLEMYLTTAEKHRLEALYPAVRGRLPEPTPELFERLLPYAFALGVVNTWVDAFATLLTERHYSPAWYSSSGPFDARSFRRSMDSMRNGVRSSAGRSGSGGGGSSGRGGGGFSGGGGGGGGGRGR